MTVQVPSIVFFFAVLSLTVIDRKRLNSIITPFSITAWPFAIIILLVNFVLIYFDFPSISLRSQLFILLNIVLLWLTGFLISFFYNINHSDKNRTIYSNVFKEFARFDLFLILISLIISIIALNHAYTILQKYGGLSFLGDQRFEEMIGVGPVAHLIQVGKVCFLLLLFIFRNSKHKILIIIALIGLFFAIASIQVKYHLIWLFIFGFVFQNLDKPPKWQLKNIILIALILFLIMNMFWISLTLAWGTFDIQDRLIWEFLIKQFLNYFVTGPICLDKWLDWNSIKPDWTLLLVFINFYYVIIGNPIRINAVPYVSNGFLETAPGLYGNVGTSYGVYYMIGGVPLTVLMTILVGVISYVVFFQSRKRNSPLLLYFNMLFLTLAMLTFFVQYFTLLSLYEMTAIFIFFIIVFQLINTVINLKQGQ